MPQPSIRYVLRAHRETAYLSPVKARTDYNEGPVQELRGMEAKYLKLHIASNIPNARSTATFDVKKRGWL